MANESERIRELELQVERLRKELSRRETAHLETIKLRERAEAKLAEGVRTAGDAACNGLNVTSSKRQPEPPRSEVARLREAPGRVLTEAGLQAHKHGCANKIARPAQWDARLPCAGCQAESALQGR